jgi:hypothetical protein
LEGKIYDDYEGNVFWDVDIKSRDFQSSAMISDKRTEKSGVVGTVTLTYQNLMDNGEIQEQKEVIILDRSKIVV